MDKMTTDAAHDIIRVLCKGSDNEDEFRTIAKRIFPHLTDTDTAYYWNSYHAVMTSSKILAVMGVHGDDLEKALQEIGEFISNQHTDEEKAEGEVPDNVTPITKH
jgi:hypothetical protein